VIRQALFAGMLAALVAVMSAHANAQDAELVVTPKKCVAVRKGNTCYQSVVLSYSASNKADVCLVLEGRDEPLACWNNVADIEFRYRVATDEGAWFHIIDEDEFILASARINVAWVYKSTRKRNRWRLF